LEGRGWREEVAGSLRLVGEPDVWELRVYVGRDAAGRVKHRYTRFVGNKRAAKRALEDLVAEVRATAEAPAEERTKWGRQTTLNEAFEAWRENGWADLSPSTVRRYESIWSVQIAPVIGKSRIAELGPYELERYFRKLKQQGLAEATVRQTRAVLNRTCKLARRWSGGVLPNPVAETELPSWALDARDEVRAPSIEEVQALLRASANEDVRVLVFLRVVTATGMRRGEACALRWSDLDAARRILVIDESIVAAHGGAIVKPPKTRASIRALAIDSGTVEMLEHLRREQTALALACGVELPPLSFVFSFEPGGSIPPYPDVMSHAFSKIRKAAGVPTDVHLHSLRHFQATAIDSVVSERQKQARLGWATVHMARHYTDPVTEEDQKAAEHVGKMIDAAAVLPQAGQRRRSSSAAS
jgi:integrase